VNVQWTDGYRDGIEIDQKIFGLHRVIPLGDRIRIAGSI
jgi:hypothetical protein